MWTGILSGGVLGLGGRIHNLVDGSHIPCHNIMLLYSINHLSLSYANLHLASHKILVGNKEVWAMPGTACACVSDLGIHGRSKLPMCVDYNVFPSGKFMNSGRVDG